VLVNTRGIHRPSEFKTVFSNTPHVCVLSTVLCHLSNDLGCGDHRRYELALERNKNLDQGTPPGHQCFAGAWCVQRLGGRAWSSAQQIGIAA
jgi:hypothetical protein